MPPAVATGVAAVTTAALQSRASGRAARGQQKATGMAFRVERDREAEAKRRYDQEYAAYQKALEQREAIRRQILGRYGITVPEPARSAQAGSGFGAGDVSPGGMPGLTPPAAPVAPSAPSGLSLGSIAGGPGPGVGPMDSPGGGAPGAQDMTAPPLIPGQGMSLGDLSDWSRWRK